MDYDRVSDLLLTCEKIASGHHLNRIQLVWTEKNRDVPRLLTNALASAAKPGRVVSVDAGDLPIVMLFQDDLDALAKADVLVIFDFQILQCDGLCQAKLYHELLRPRTIRLKTTIIFSKDDVFEGEFTEPIKVLMKTGNKYKI